MKNVPLISTKLDNIYFLYRTSWHTFLSESCLYSSEKSQILTKDQLLAFLIIIDLSWIGTSDLKGWNNESPK